MHWADVIAKKVMKNHPQDNVVATGITPSGEIHVGNMREILTGDIIRRALKDNGDGNAKLIYIGDSFDPLRKVYPFLDDSYSQHVGKPLSEIPCPCGCHQHYAEHFLEPFLATLGELGVEHETVLTHELYEEGSYEEGTKRILDSRDKVREILVRISGRELPATWIPYTPKCHACGKFNARAEGYDYPFVDYACSCGHEGRSDIRRNDGKLPWRVDWPTRWWFLGVTIEPFGKDHGAAGGSYDTGAAIVKDVFGRDPPPRHVYEWIQLKGKGAMSSSKGIVVSGKNMLKITPPEVLRYLIASTNIAKHIDFDPGLGILNLVDEFDKLEAAYFAGDLSPDEQRVYELSSPDYIFHDMSSLTLDDIKADERTPPPSVGVPGEVSRKEESSLSLSIPYRHLVTVYQVGRSFDAALSILLRTENRSSFSEEEKIHLLHRLACVKNWLKVFAPDTVKFDIVLEPPAAELPEEEAGFLERLLHQFNSISWNGEDIHRAIYETATEVLNPKKAFQLLYKVFLDQKQGPRLGYFLSSLERKFVITRLQHYVN